MLDQKFDFGFDAFIGAVEMPIKTTDSYGSPTFSQTCGCTEQSFCGSCQSQCGTCGC